MLRIAYAKLTKRRFAITLYQSTNLQTAADHRGPSSDLKTASLTRGRLTLGGWPMSRQLFKLLSTISACIILSACGNSDNTTAKNHSENNNTSNTDDVKSADSSNYDILITNGQVIVGDGSPAISADIGITGDVIELLGDGSSSTAARTIDAAGLTVAPGFIDMHTHADDALGNPEYSPLLNFLMQGVTTVRPGADGSGSYEIARTKAEWEANGMGLNATMFAGHRVIREAVMGDDQLRSPTAEELAEMSSLVRAAMEEGAWGLSAQLEYGGYEVHVTTDEMIEIAKPVADYDGFYVAHIRDEASKFMDSVDETIAIGEGAGIRTNVTHIKATGRDNWGTMYDVVKRINDARAEGVPITADQYPFLQGAPIDYVTALIDVPQSLDELYQLSQGVHEGDVTAEGPDNGRALFVEKLQAALRDPEMREQLKQSTYEDRVANPSPVAVGAGRIFE